MSLDLNLLTPSLRQAVTDPDYVLGMGIVRIQGEVLAPTDLVLFQCPWAHDLAHCIPVQEALARYPHLVQGPDKDACIMAPGGHRYLEGFEGNGILYLPVTTAARLHQVQLAVEFF